MKLLPQIISVVIKSKEQVILHMAKLLALLLGVLPIEDPRALAPVFKNRSQEAGNPRIKPARAQTWM